MKKILFIDRDGTLIAEPDDFQVDSIAKLRFLPNVIPALLKLKTAGYSLVMVTNQDGLGTSQFPTQDFQIPHDMMLAVFASQGIEFEAIRICPHVPEAGCFCRKPQIGLVQDYVIEQVIDRNNSFVIGDRITDLQLAVNLGIQGIRIDPTSTIQTWDDIVDAILKRDRQAVKSRKTTETEIHIAVNLDKESPSHIQSGIKFLDHMLEQLAKHAGIHVSIQANGDLDIDDHHTVEDIAILLGEAIRTALGDKLGIARYGFVLPMDEALAQVALDFSGRAHFEFKGAFFRDKVGDLTLELVPHFFKSFAESLKATLHISVVGDNHHHMVEGIFKCVGRTMRQAIQRIDTHLPSTKGVL